MGVSPIAQHLPAVPKISHDVSARSTIVALRPWRASSVESFCFDRRPDCVLDKSGFVNRVGDWLPIRRRPRSPFQHARRQPRLFDQSIETKQFDLAAHEIRDARLGNAKQFGGL